jgi:hypothetical protein
VRPREKSRAAAAVRAAAVHAAVAALLAGTCGVVDQTVAAEGAHAAHHHSALLSGAGCDCCCCHCHCHCCGGCWGLRQGVSGSGAAAEGHAVVIVTVVIVVGVMQAVV